MIPSDADTDKTRERIKEGFANLDLRTVRTLDLTPPAPSRPCKPIVVTSIAECISNIAIKISSTDTMSRSEQVELFRLIEGMAKQAIELSQEEAA